MTIEPGMVFALETFWPSTDGWSAARIEEEIVVTPTGHEVITRFPAEELLVAGAHYFTVNGPLPTTRETEAPPSERVLEMIEASAKTERVASFGLKAIAARSPSPHKNTMAFSVVMPALEMAQETGKLIAWRKQEGDRVTKGEPLLEIETDKAVVEVEAPADGILAGIKAARRRRHSRGPDHRVDRRSRRNSLRPRANHMQRPTARAGSSERRNRTLRRVRSSALNLPSASDRKNFSQGSPPRERIGRRYRHGAWLRSRRRNSRRRTCKPRLRAKLCIADRASRRISQEHRSPDYSRPPHGRTHYAELDHRPSFLRHP